MYRFICFSILQLSFYLLGYGQTTTFIDASNSPYFIQNDLTINEGDSLILGPGAIVLIANGIDINVYGCFEIRGVAGNPAKMQPLEDFGWGQIKVYDSSDSLLLNHAEINNGRLLVYNNHVKLRNVTFSNTQNLEWNGAIGRFYFGSLYINNCSISGSNKGEGFLVHSVDNATITNCSFNSIPDAVEFLNCNYGRIGKSEFRSIPDDAIDLNHCLGTVVDSNIIINVADRGMEIGSENNGSSIDIKVERNIIANCYEGINFKGGSTGSVVHNTIFNNQTGITSLLSDTPNLPSHLTVSNTIFYSNTTDLFKEESSTVLTNYCLSDNSTLEGEQNLLADPFLISPYLENFEISPLSPCIDSGSNSFQNDPDGTPPDIGAVYQSVRPNDDILSSIFHIWPNPCNKNLYVKSLVEMNSIEVINCFGQTIATEVANSPYHLTLVVSSLSSGYYTLMINSAEQSFFTSFVKF